MINKEQLKIFGRELIRDLTPGKVELRLFVEEKAEWKPVPRADYDLAKASGTSSPLVTAMPHRLAGTLSAAWFEVPSLKVAAELTFHAPPAEDQIKAFETRIDGILRNAINAYHVSHNPLTGLLARDAFRTVLKDNIVQFNENLNTGRSAQEEGRLRVLSVLLFDVDRFKQVNDNFGHLYGDQVLKIFARRLTQVADAIEQEYAGQVNLRVAHPSGEEYIVLIEGSVDASTIREMAERFCRRMEEEPLPSEHEWSSLIGEHPEIEEIVFPASSERHLTTSVGVAVYAPNSANSPEAEMLGLLDNADTALSRSKARGRNQVTVFDQIILDCGKVLEYDPQTRVAAIDIGSRVGVTVGQEFVVYTETFSGKTPFITDDGRTRKMVGRYPKIEFARLTVFNVQAEIAFALPTERPRSDTSALLIPEGCRLEAVPLGSIAHLVSVPGEQGVAGNAMDGGTVQGIETLNRAVLATLRVGETPAAAVFRFKDAINFTKKYGTAAFNRNLAKLFADLNRIFPNETLGIIGETAICLTGSDRNITPNALRKAIAACATRDELVLICGYFYAEDSAARVGIKEVDPRYAVDFAQYAVSDHGLDKTDGRLILFDLDRAKDLLKALCAGRASQGVVDYQRFREANFVHHTLDNLGGVCYSKQNRFDKAADAYEAAIVKARREVVYRGNLAIVTYRSGQHDRALKWLNEMDETQLQELKKSYPYSYVCYAMHLVQASRLGLPGFKYERLLLVGAEALALPEISRYANGVGHLRDALAAPAGALR